MSGKEDPDFSYRKVEEKIHLLVGNFSQVYKSGGQLIHKFCVCDFFTMLLSVTRIKPVETQKTV